jgi:hypothetical protein
MMRQTPLAVPRTIPNRRIASTAYSLHVGVKRQHLGRRGETSVW